MSGVMNFGYLMALITMGGGGRFIGEPSPELADTAGPRLGVGLGVGDVCGAGDNI